MAAATTAATTARPTAGTGLLAHIREGEAAGSIGETIAAGDKVREDLNRASAAMYAWGDAQYTNVKKTGKWPAVLRGLDKENSARRQRKKYYAAGAALKDAATAVRSVVVDQEEVLAANTAKGTGYDATK
jgi:hypothetical protein